MKAGKTKHGGKLIQPRWIRIALIVLLFLVGARLALPAVVKAYVNRQLGKTPEYQGQIGSVSLHLWRGAYRIRDISIFKTAGGIPAPLFSAPQMDLSMEWRELFHGALAGEVILEKPKVNFVSGPTAAETQTGKEADWGKTLRSLFPFKINRFQVRSGEVHFQNLHSSPPVDIFLHRLAATATNLTNTRDIKTRLPAGVTGRATALGDGVVDFHLQLDPLASGPTFEATTQLTNVSLPALNDFLRAYGKFDVERGLFSLYTSVAAKDGSYEGYLKVFFENLDVFEWEKERKKNALEVFWQAIVGTLTTVFKNQPKDRLAMKIPISGSYEQNKVGVWTAVATMLRNAFIRALIPKLDEPVKVENITEKKETRVALPPPGKGAEELKSRSMQPALPVKDQ